METVPGSSARSVPMNVTGEGDISGGQELPRMNLRAALEGCVSLFFSIFFASSCCCDQQTSVCV